VALAVKRTAWLGVTAAWLCATACLRPDNSPSSAVSVKHRLQLAYLAARATFLRRCFGQRQYSHQFLSVARSSRFTPPCLWTLSFGHI
jgi:hypothetical protein